MLPTAIPRVAKEQQEVGRPGKRAEQGELDEELK
jgi:hypothetical protein